MLIYASTSITKECFEMDDFENIEIEEGKDDDFEHYPIFRIWERLINDCEHLRKKYNETKDKHYWKELVRLLPESWLQTRTITMNYENVLNMVKYRMNHKLTEWSESFMGWVKSLPYANEFIFIS